MSTQINVTVGSGGLSDKARQLQTAARQAQLEKERQQRIEVQGTEQRNAKLEAEGKGPDGSLLYGSGFKQPEVKLRPAANRTGVPAVSSYFTSILGDGTLLLTSGNGLYQVSLDFPPALEQPTWPVLVNTKYSGFYDLEGPPTNSSLLQRQDERTQFGDPNFFNYEDVIQVYRKNRQTFSRGATTIQAFPLGNGNALVVMGRYAAYASVLTDTYLKIRDNNNFEAGEFTNELVEYNYSVAVETDWIEQEDWIGAIVGDNVASTAAVPDSLKNALRIEISTENTLSPFVPFIGACRYAGGGAFKEDNDYSTQPYVCAGWPGEWGYENYVDYFNPGPLFRIEVEYPLQDKQISYKSSDLSSYGLLRNGSVLFSGFSTTPASWFLVDSDSTSDALNSVATHQNLYSLESSDTFKFGELFRSRYLIDTTLENPRWWSGDSLKGSVFSFPPPLDSKWRSGVKITSSQTSNAQRHFINDWGRKSFCAQQAARYGISL